MTDSIHDAEPDTSEATVRALLAHECPQWSRFPLEKLRTSGTDNAMWRVHVSASSDVVVRLPRRPGAASNIHWEMELLRAVAESTLRAVVRTPSVLHVGGPHNGFPHAWAVLSWLEGSDAWSLRDDTATPLEPLAVDLGEAIAAIRELRVKAPARVPGQRGGPIEPLVQRIGRWLDDPAWHASELLDVDAVRRLAAEALETAHEPVTTGFVHGDLIPGNLLVESGRLAAIIDWGGAGRADVAQDLAPAWSVLEGRSRHVFRQALEVDDAAWIRGRTIELEHAVGGVLYYVPRRHPLAEVMTRTLWRILQER